jgi:Holliday junction resolvase RusA-like endonuclease
MTKSNEIIITIDTEDLENYEKHYFFLHPRAQKKPIKHPFHESINVWMIMKRPMMNALKQKWKDFIIWLVNERGYTNLHINKCEISQTVYYPNNRRHDTDNSVPKFILDGLVESGMIIDDDSAHVTKLTLMCATDVEHPRTELLITILDDGTQRIEGGI